MQTRLPPVLAYHHVCNYLYPTIARVSTKQFHKQINFLIEQNYFFIKLIDLFKDDAKSTIAPQRMVGITFDDALQCVYHNAFPVLHKNGIPATVFVVSGYVGKDCHWDYYPTFKRCSHMGWDQLRILAENNIEIGCHTTSHIDLNSLTMSRLKVEISDSKNFIEDKLGKEVKFISYPFGRYNKRVIEACKEAGFLGGVTLNPVAEIKDPFLIPRRAVYLFDNQRYFQKKLKVTNKITLEFLKLRLINFFSWGTIILQNLKTR